MVDTYALRDKLEMYSDWQKKVMMSHVVRIQFNTNCSVGCPDCGLGAVPLIQDGMPREGFAMAWDFYTNLVDTYHSLWDRTFISLYWRSDPFDYSSHGKGFRDVFDYFHSRVTPAGGMGIQTAVPSGKEDEVLQNLDIVGEINLIHSKQRLSGFISKALGINPDAEHIFTEGERYKLGPNNINDLSNRSIQCDNGVILTPDNIYSVRTVVPSADHPYGYILSEVSPDNFKIAAASHDPGCIPRFQLSDRYLHFYNRWLNEGFHEITNENDELREHLRHYFVVRFGFLLALEQDRAYYQRVFGGILNCVETGGRPLNDLEQLLIRELEENAEKEK